MFLSFLNCYSKDILIVMFDVIYFKILTVRDMLVDFKSLVSNCNSDKYCVQLVMTGVVEKHPTGLEFELRILEMPGSFIFI